MFPISLYVTFFSFSAPLVHSHSVSFLALCVSEEGSGICHPLEEGMDRGRAWWELSSTAWLFQHCGSNAVHKVGECCEEVRHTRTSVFSHSQNGKPVWGERGRFQWELHTRLNPEQEGPLAMGGSRVKVSSKLFIFK